VRNLTTGSLFVLAVMVAASNSWAGVPCAGTSDVWAETYSADAGDTVELYVIVRDCYGQPLSNRVCNFYTDRGAQDIIIGSPLTTDVNGFAQVEVVTPFPGQSEIGVSSGGVALGPASQVLVWTGEGLGTPLLRVGAWMNPESWHDWIGGAGGTTPLELHISDPAGFIDSVQFFYSTDGGGHWNHIATDLQGTDDYENTYGPTFPSGDGWSASLDHDEIHTEIIELDLAAIAHLHGNIIQVEESVTYLGSPPSEVEFSISDWDTVFTEFLWLGVMSGDVVIEKAVVRVEAKVDTFSKDIPQIDQRTHSDNHCAPTAASACLKYFEGQGDTTVAGGLSNDDLVDAIAVKMKTDPETGTKTAMVSKGLKDWIEDHGDGYTIRVTQAGGFGEDDWKKMRNELEACQNVLTKVTWTNNESHRMTLNSIVNDTLPNGRVRVDWMDPWTAGYEYGELDTKTGHIQNLTGAGGGGTGTITQTLIVCPKEPDEEGPEKPGKEVIPNPGPGPIPIPMPAGGPGQWNFIHIIIIDTNGFAHPFVFIVMWLPPAGIEDGRGDVPVDFELNQGEPNPFTDRTEIRYAVPVESAVTLDIYDVLGKKVRTLVEGTVGPGYHTAVWEGRDDYGRTVAPGIYYAKMKAPRYGGSCKVILVR
jgi:hypothetical protein